MFLEQLPVTAQIRYDIGFNTQFYGETPIGIPGPYNSLNYGVVFDATPSAGADALPGVTIINGVNSSDLGGYSPYARAVGVPEATTWMMFAAGLLTFSISRWKKPTA